MPHPAPSSLPPQSLGSSRTVLLYVITVTGWFLGLNVLARALPSPLSQTLLGLKIAGYLGGSFAVLYKRLAANTQAQDLHTSIHTELLRTLGIELVFLLLSSLTLLFYHTLEIAETARASLVNSGILSLIETLVCLSLSKNVFHLCQQTIQNCSLQQIADESELYRHFYQLPFAGMATCTLDGKKLDQFNDKLCAILGYPREELQGMDWRQITHPDDIAAETQAFASILCGESDGYTLEKRFIRKDGETVYTTIDVHAIHSRDGHISRMAALVQDTTEHRRISQKLRDSEQSYTTLADSAPALIWLAGTDKLCNYFNKTWLAFTGRTLEQEMGNRWAEGVHPEDFAYCLDHYISHFDRRLPFSMDYRLRNYRGEYRWIRDNGSPRYSSTGAFLGYIGYCLDVTDRVLAQQALEESEARLRLIVRNLPMILCTIDAEGIFTMSDGKGLHALGLKPGEVVGRSVFELYADYPKAIEYIRLAMGGEKIQAQTLVNGVYYENIFAPLPGDGKTSGIMITSLDITARKHAEEEQQHNMQRMESLLRVANFHAPNTQELLNYILYEAMQLCASEYGCIFMNDKESNTYALASKTHNLQQILDLPPQQTRLLPKEIRPFGDAAHLTHPVFSHMLKHPPKNYTIKPEWVDKIAGLSAPVINGGKIVAIIGILRKERNYDADTASQLMQFIAAAWNLVERQQADDRLIRISDLMNVSQRLAHVGGWEYTPADQSLYWTEQNYRIFELDPKLYKPDLKNVVEYFTPESRKIREEAFARALAEGTGYDLELEIVTAKGHQKKLRASCTVIKEGEVPRRVTGALLDITPYKTIEAELRQHKEHLEELIAQRTQELVQALDTAERATRSKSAFLANMSHEIRTPITAVLGMTHLALQTNPSAKQRSYLEKISISANLLLGVINDILDFSKIEAGRLELASSEFLLSDVIDKTIAVTALKSAEKHLEFLIRIDDQTPYSLMGDATRLGQILINLCSNAVKFTERGEITLTVSSSGTEDNTSVEITFEVRDTGIGLSPEQIPLLFKPFSQVDSSNARRFGGTGLGLAICKQLVEMMGGCIHVDSQLGMGSTFRFSVPFKLGASTLASSLPAATPEQSLEILLVDSNNGAQTIIAELITRMGYTCQRAYSSTSALGMLTAHPRQRADLLLFDWKEKPEDIHALMALLRQRKSSAKSIKMSFGTELEREKYPTPYEADAELFKPVTASSLYDSIMNATGNERKAQAPNPARLSPHTHGLLGAKILLAEDNAFNQQVIQEILESAGFEICIAENGQIALNRAQAEHFDAILMDVQMPIMDGLEATRQIRTIDRLGKLPIIAMTAHALLEEQRRCLEAGMNDFMTKPVDPEAIISKLNFWVLGKSVKHRSNTHEQPRTSIQQRTELGDDPPGIKIAKGLAYCNNRPDFYLKMLDGFVQHKQDAVQKLRMAIETQAFDSARTMAHSMKSVAATIGAEELSGQAAVLEQSLRSTSEGDQLGTQLSQIETRLKEALHSIALITKRPEAVAARNVNNLNHAASALENAIKIRDYLLTDIGEALEYMPDLLDVTHQTELAELTQTLNAALNDFEVERARSILTHLISRLESGGVLQ